MMSLVILVRHFWRSERAWFMAGIGASAATILAGMALLGLSGWFITASAFAGIAGVGLTFDFFRPSAGIRFLALGRTAGRYAERLVTHDATLRFLSVLRVELLRGIARLDNARLSFLRGSEMLQRLTADIDALDNLYLRIVLPLIVFLIVGSVLILALSVFGILLALSVALVLMAGLSAVLASGYFSRRDSRRHAVALEALRVRAIDLVRAQGDLVVAGSLGLQRQAVLRAGDALARTGRRLMRVQLVSDAVLSLLSSAFVLVALLLATNAYRQGSMDAPQLVLILCVAFAAVESIGALRRGAVEFGRTALAARRLAPLLDSTAAPAPAPRPADPQVSHVAPLSFEDVTFRFAPDRAPVLQHVTIGIGKGERVALIGASGSGKSTLLALAAGLITPTRSRVLVDGRSAMLQPGGAVGLLTQRSELFHDTIANNLRIAAPGADDAALWSALELVELADLVRSLPGGLNAGLGEGGAGLSGGEARRLALARIVLLSPRVWLLDEPTAGLDEAQAKRVMRNVMRAAGDSTVLVAAHHSREAAFVDRILQLGPLGTIDADQGAVAHGGAWVSSRGPWPLQSI